MLWKKASEGYLAAERSKRKRRKSHSDQRRAIDRGDEARSAICTRDRPLQRISCKDVDRGTCTHSRMHAYPTPTRSASKTRLICVHAWRNRFSEARRGRQRKSARYYFVTLFARCARGRNRGANAPEVFKFRPWFRKRESYPRNTKKRGKQRLRMENDGTRARYIISTKDLAWDWIVRRRRGTESFSIRFRNDQSRKPIVMVAAGKTDFHARPIARNTLTRLPLLEFASLPRHTGRVSN